MEKRARRAADGPSLVSSLFSRYFFPNSRVI